MFAEIITIGDEILIGQVIDTNSAWMGEKLNAVGIKVKQITSISDKSEAIKAALSAALTRADIVLITGGLGPTRDDVTKSSLASYFNMKMRVDEDTLRNVENFFTKLNRPLLEVNKLQAEVPEGCVVLLNDYGTAPCMWFEVESKVVVSMPGVPFEMKYLMEDKVIPKLTEKFSMPFIYHKTILTANIGESFLAELLTTVEDNLPEHISLAYLPKLGQVRLRLSGVGANYDHLKKEVDAIAKQIISIANDYVLAEVDTTLDAVVLTELISRNKTLSTAESCTGGNIGHMLTLNAGGSAAYVGGAITYNKQIKHQVLGVNKEILENFGAVSEETVKEMALGALNVFQSDYAIATTGIAGPATDNDEKPVGTVWIGFASKQGVQTKLFNFSGKREQIIDRATSAALSFLLYHLKKEDK